MKATLIRADRVYVWAGSLLREWRERAGLSPEGLARLAEITEQSVRNYEAGQSPSAAMAAKLAAIITAVLKEANPETTVELTPNSFFVIHDRTATADL